MAKKKQFEEAVNYTGKNVGGAIDQATGGRGTQEAAPPEERRTRQEEMRTQGRKGCKAARINMAFTPENHAFIKFAARYKGMTLTEFTNHMIEEYRAEHADAYNKARGISEEL